MSLYAKSRHTFFEQNSTTLATETWFSAEKRTTKRIEFKQYNVEEAAKLRLPKQH
jgi:hypothetical protein